MFGRDGFDSRKMRKMMKRMGVKMEELSDVQEVVIRLSDKELVISDPQVALTEVGGQRTYQVVGEAHEREMKIEIPDEGIELVMERAEVGRDEAAEALKMADGDIAKAIIDLKKT